MKSQLFTAAETDNISMFREALSKGAEINEVDENGTTPLMLACKLGHTELVKFILSRGADINLVDKQGRTAVRLAQIYNKSDLLSLFGVVNEVESDTEKKVIPSGLLKLADNLFPVLKEVEPIIKTLTEVQRKQMQNDFTNIVSLLRKSVEWSLYDGLGLSLALVLLIYPENFDENFNNIKNQPELENLIKEIVASETKDLQDNPSPFQTFSFKSLETLNAESANKLKKAIYDFSEIIANADGIITVRESETLKFLSSILYKENKLDLKTMQKKELSKADLASILEELNSLVGMDNIKNDIHSLINIININKLRNKEGLPEMNLSLHSVFMGPPGTGKTTIARILSKIYYALDLLPQNNFKETDRSGLVGGYLGQTAIKTDKIINDALNGILFIDEAYSLAGDNMDDYGKEAISTLLKRMEDYRDKLIIIVAGYEHEMTHFINSNPGLKSRFNRYFHFKDYTPAELTEIFKRLAADKKLVLKEEALKRVKELFELLYSGKDNTFGNARVARNAFEKSYENMANRTSSITPITREILTTIEGVDIPSIVELNT